MSEPVDAYESEESAGIPEFAKDPLGIVRRRWRWMLLLAVLAGSAAAAVIAVLPPTYEASARLLLSSQRVPEEFVRQISVESMGEQVGAILGEVLSSDSIQDLAEEQNFRERTGFEGPDTALVDAIRDSVAVEQDSEMAGRRARGGSTYIFAVRYQSEDPELSADMANGIVDNFTSAHARRQSRQAQLATQFLRREAERTRAELEAVRSRIAEYKGRHQGELPSGLDTKLARLTRLQQQRDSLATQLSDAESRLITLRSQGVGDQRTELLSELQGRLVNQLTLHTEDHPNVKALERQIASLERQIEESPPSRSSASSPAEMGLQNDIRTLRNQIRNVEAEIARLDESVSKIPAHQEELTSLEQQETLLQEKYVDASRKVGEAELAESLQREQQGTSVSVLQPAWPPSSPQRSVVQMILFGIAATVGASLAIALLLELLDPVMLTASQLERATGLANLGVVPKIR